MVLKLFGEGQKLSQISVQMTQSYNKTKEVEIKRGKYFFF